MFSMMWKKHKWPKEKGYWKKIQQNKVHANKLKKCYSILILNIVVVKALLNVDGNALKKLRSVRSLHPISFWYFQS